jgi:hypothetical protein
MQWPSITGSRCFIHDAKQPGLWDSEPEQGSLPEKLISALVPVLARHTRTPERCWFGVWDGHGCLAIGDNEAPDLSFRIGGYCCLPARLAPCARRCACRPGGSPRTCGGLTTEPGASRPRLIP